jgi:hypothetical protein
LARAGNLSDAATVAEQIDEPWFASVTWLELARAHRRRHERFAGQIALSTAVSAISAIREPESAQVDCWCQLAIEAVTLADLGYMQVGWEKASLVAEHCTDRAIRKMLFREIALAQAKTGQLRTAIRTWERAQIRDPKSQQALLADLAVIATQFGDSQAAVGLLPCILEPSIRCNALLALSKEAKRGGRSEAAMSMLEQVYEGAGQIEDAAVAYRLRREAIVLRLEWRGATGLGPWLVPLEKPTTELNNPLNAQCEERDNAELLARIPGAEKAVRNAYERALQQAEMVKSPLWLSAGRSAIAHSEASVGMLAEAEELARLISDRSQRRSVWSHIAYCWQ